MCLCFLNKQHLHCDLLKLQPSDWGQGLILCASLYRSLPACVLIHSHLHSRTQKGISNGCRRLQVDVDFTVPCVTSLSVCVCLHYCAGERCRLWDKTLSDNTPPPATLQSLFNLRRAVAKLTRGAAPCDDHLVSWKKEDNDVPITENLGKPSDTDKQKVFKGEVHPKIKILSFLVTKTKTSALKSLHWVTIQKAIIVIFFYPSPGLSLLGLFLFFFFFIV